MHDILVAFIYLFAAPVGLSLFGWILPRNGAVVNCFSAVEMYFVKSYSPFWRAGRKFCTIHQGKISAQGEQMCAQNAISQ